MALSAMFVLLMQAGFLLLEAGRTRTRNSISVAQKNLTDVALCWALFGLVGFAIAFGPTVNGGVLGDPFWRWSTDAQGVVFIFQCGFCAAAATIVSGAVAERMRFVVYVALTAFVALVIYPLFARLAWGDLLIPGGAAPLGELGFIDHAGATVVHSIGGWAALAAACMLGPRRDVPKGAQIQGHSEVLALCGTLLLLVGWLGFNAGAETPGTPGFANALVNTLLAGVTGASVGMLSGAIADGGHTRPKHSINGLLGGLVAITASASFVDRDTAMAIGAVGAFAAFVAAAGFRRLGVDDPVDAAAVHGVAGVVGTLAVAAVAPVDLLAGGSRLQQLEAQATGAVVAFVLAFGGVTLLLALLRSITPIRVSPMDERMGLNAAEHGSLLGVDQVRSALEDRVASAGTERRTIAQFDPLAVDPGSEGAEIADAVNTLMERYELSQAALLDARNRMRDFAANANDFLWETDEELRLIFVSARFQDLFGVKPAEVVGRNIIDILAIRRAEAALIKLKRRDGGSFDNVIGAIVDRDVERRLIRLRGAAYCDENGEILGLRGAGEDITDQAAAEERLRRQALQDDVTGALNRRGLREHLSDLICADDSSAAFAVIAFDLDGFRRVNEAHGHDTGDRALMSTAARLQSLLPQSGALARVGGDEFIAVLSNLAPDDAQARALSWAKRAIASIERPVDASDDPADRFILSASAGVSIACGGAAPLDQLLQQADHALYHAKRSGRGCAVAFDPALDSAEEQKQSMLSAMARGLEMGEFFLEYQPQCCSTTGRILGFEALVRWRRPGIGAIPPSVFVPLAEQSTLIHKLGAFVLENAIPTAADWKRRSPAAKDIVISVNVSPRQLLVDDFADQIETLLRDSGLAPSELELEITEGVFLEDAEACIEKLARLRSLGVSIAIDDFGTGFSSLGYLKHLPLNRLKIDKSFVDSVLDDDQSVTILDSVIRLGKSLGLSVIAEGVESESQRIKLTELGCPMYQGFLRSRAVSAEEALAFIEQQSHDPERAAG